MWAREKARMHALYGYRCVHCGHGDAREADHLIPLKADPTQRPDGAAWRPSHGSNSPCPVCGRKCNQERGTKPIEAPMITTREW